MKVAKKPIKKEIQCRCGVVTSKFAQTEDWGSICSKCAKDDFNTCKGCKKIWNIDSLTDTREQSQFCKKCLKEHTFRCNECTSLVENRHVNADRTMCTWCVEEGMADNDENYRTNKTYRSATKGEIVKSIRPFGVEIETQYDNSDQARKAIAEFPKGVNVGSDGSIQGAGIEIRTPVLAGKKGEKLITDICTILGKNKFKVDKSCGLHVHVDAEDFDRSDEGSVFYKIKSIFLFYLAFEDVILSFIPKSRRTNRYCLPLRNDYNFKEIRDTESSGDMEKIWYRARAKNDLRHIKNDKKHGSRYHGINMHTLIAFRHLEIRFHSGTINAKKINEWINLHLSIVDNISGKIPTWDRLQEANSVIDIGQKTKLFFSYLNLSDSSTHYFLSRQEIFREEEKMEVDNKVKEETQKALSDEKEA